VVDLGFADVQNGAHFIFGKKFVHKQCRVSRSSVCWSKQLPLCPLLRLFCRASPLDITERLLRNVGFTVCPSARSAGWRMYGNLSFLS